LEGLSRGNAIKTFPISLQGTFLSFGIISTLRGDIFIDRMSALREATQTITLIILTRVGRTHTTPFTFGVSITGGRSITFTLDFTLTYTTTEVTVMSTTEITIMSCLILI
jgi:hypothetical protein